MGRLVSAVIPTFRRPALLRETVASALLQPETLEVIVVDDSPEGSARQCAASFDDPRVIYLLNPEPSGGKPAVPRNLGGRMARAKYVQFLDDDDLVAPGAYAALTSALDLNPDVGVAFGVVQPFGDPAAMRKEVPYFNDAARRARLAARSGSKLWMVTAILHQATVLVNSACMIRRQHIEAISGYQTHVVPLDDVDFYLRAIRRFGVSFVDRVVLHYRVGHLSLMHAPAHEERCNQAYQHIAREYQEVYGPLEYRAMQIFARTVLRFL